MKEALRILDTKYNAYHHKQHLFVVFTKKNMVGLATMIHIMVSVESRMSVGNQIKLTTGDFAIPRK